MEKNNFEDFYEVPNLNFDISKCWEIVPADHEKKNEKVTFETHVMV